MLISTVKSPNGTQLMLYLPPPRTPPNPTVFDKKGFAVGFREKEVPIVQSRNVLYNQRPGDSCFQLALCISASVKKSAEGRVPAPHGAREREGPCPNGGSADLQELRAPP